MRDTFVRYQSMLTLEHYNELSKLLTENQVRFHNYKDYSLTDRGNINRNNYYQISVHIADLEKADKIFLPLEEEWQKDHEDDQYYLHQFSNDELKEILKNHLEWSGFDYVFAKKILASRGINFTPYALEEMRKAQYGKYGSYPDAAKIVRLGYLFSFLVPPAGVLIGVWLVQQKEIDKLGSKDFMYGRKDRRHGPILIVFGGLLSAIAFYLIRDRYF